MPNKFQWRSFTIAPSGSIIETVHATTPKLAWLQEQVGGYIETVPYFTKAFGRTRGTAYANEDGWAKQLRFNYEATRLWQSQCLTTTHLLGPVVITFREATQ